MKYLMKVVNALLAAAMFPVVLFLDFIFFQFGTNDKAQPLFQQINPDSAGVGIEESLSLFDFIQIARGDHIYSNIFSGMTSKGFTWPEAFGPINARLIAFAVFLVLCLLIAIFIIVWSICSDKKLPVILAAGGGIVSAIIMICCFNSAANVLVSGEIGLSALISDSSWLTDLLFGFIGIDTFMLGGFQSGIIIVFICIIVWTGAFALIEIGDNEEEKAKKK